jgi:hypothetical protein
LVQAYYENLLKLEIDKSGKDLTRLCFYSFDENLYYNENATVFESAAKQSVLSINEPQITESPSENVLAPPLLWRGAGGEDFEAIYNHCIKFTEKKVQYANGSRNVFVHQLACNMNRKAVPMAIALGFIQTDFNYDDKEVLQAVTSGYRNILEFGKTEKSTIPNEKQKKQTSKNIDDEDDEDDDKPRVTQIDKLENFLSGKYVFRHNMVSSKLEFQYFGKKKWNVMNDFIENSMLRECLKARIKTNLSSLRNLLYSDFCQLFNPFEDYFYNLPTYDEKTEVNKD